MFPIYLDGTLIGDAERVYRTPAEEFELSRIDLAPGKEYQGEAANGPDAILDLAGFGHFSRRRLITPLEHGSILFDRFGTHYRLAASASVIAFKAALPALAFEQKSSCGTVIATRSRRGESKGLINFGAAAVRAKTGPDAS